MARRADDGAAVTDFPNMTLALAKYYASIYRTDGEKDHPSLSEPSPIMDDPHFTPAAVHMGLSL